MSNRKRNDRAIPAYTERDVGRELLLCALAKVFDAKGQKSFATVPLVGRRLWPPAWFLRSRPTDGTVLQPIVEELNRWGRQLRHEWEASWMLFRFPVAKCIVLPAVATWALPSKA